MFRNSDFTIIGKGEIGDKARQLIEKTPIIKEAGFYVPHRTILAEGFFDDFFQHNDISDTLRNVAIDKDLKYLLSMANFPSDYDSMIENIISSHNNNPLVVRSSAKGDSRGTGTYDTKFSDATIPSVKDAIKQVLSSYFSESAELFRRDANTGEGFGIIIEPVIGHTFTDALSDNESYKTFAPILSGYGYTSTPFNEGYVNVVPGMCGGVDVKTGEKITSEDVIAHNGDLGSIINEKLEEFFHSHSYISSALLNLSSHSHNGPGEFLGKAFFFNSPFHDAEPYFDGRNIHYEEKFVRRSSLQLYNFVPERFQGFNIKSLFDMMSHTEERVGRPQYLEWAMTVHNNTPRYWITQIADVDEKADFYDFTDPGQVLFKANKVHGTGIKECVDIVNVWNPSDIDDLYKFNKQNKNYILIYTARVTTSIADTRLQYSDYNNASVLIELQDMHTEADPLSHLGTQAMLTGKFIGALLDYKDHRPNWNLFNSRAEKINYMKIYRGKLQVIASQRQDKLLVSAKE